MAAGEAVAAGEPVGSGDALGSVAAGGTFSGYQVKAAPPLPVSEGSPQRRAKLPSAWVSSWHLVSP